MLSASFTIALTGNLFDKKNGWMAGIWVYFSFAFLSFFLDFEDDQFAIPLLFLSLFLFTKGLMEKKLKYKVASVVCVLVAGLFWKNSIVWLVGLGLIWLPAIFLSFFVITLFNPTAFPGAVTSDLRVLESWPFLAFADYMFLLAGFLFLPLILLPSAAWFTLVAALNWKNNIFLLPFLAIGFNSFFQKLNKSYRMSFTIIFSAMVLISPIIILDRMPAESEWDAIDFAMQKSEEPDKELMNAWGYGYWIEWKDGVPSAKGWFGTQNYAQDAIVLEDTGLDFPYCEKLKDFKRMAVYDCTEPID